jgi:DNA gyrase subunit A
MVILNRLYKYTQMETSLGIIMLAIAHGRPQILTLKEILQHFIGHRKDVIIRRTEFDLQRAEQRAHILEGLKKALDFLDEIIDLIRSSAEPKEAKQRLVEQFEFSDVQAQAILDMKLQRLTGLEREKINSEYQDLIKNIERFRSILGSPTLVLKIVKDEMLENISKYGDERRTEIIADQDDIDIEDLIANEDMVVTISHDGYIKRNPISLYRAQRRGGKGLTGVKTKAEDFVEILFVAASHDYLLFFTNQGRIYWKKVHEVPEGSRVSRGKAIVNLLQLQKGERVATTLPVRSFDDAKYVIMATKEGIVKKSELVFFSHPRANGIIAITIREGNELIAARVTNGDQDVFLSTRFGKSIRFHEREIRSMGRLAAGNIGIRLEEGDEVVSMEVLDEGATIVTVTENGYGKRTLTEQYRQQSRGGKGVLTIKTSERNGAVVSTLQATDQDQIMIITSDGKIIRLRVADISVISRNTQGVKLIGLGEGEKVVGVARLMEEEE